MGMSDDGNSDGGNSDGGNASDEEAFLSARERNSDWYEEARRSSGADSPCMSARSDLYWTPRSDGISELDLGGAFTPNLMPKEFEAVCII
jgi:hypothetical protein